MPLEASYLLFGSFAPGAGADYEFYDSSYGKYKVITGLREIILGIQCYGFALS